jgi:hypothetical protein
VAALGFGRIGTVARARTQRILDAVEPLLLVMLVPAVAISFGVIPAVIGWVS